MDKATSGIHHEEDKIEPLSEEIFLSERLRKAWLLTCEAYGIDPENPPKMDKRMFFAGTHEERKSLTLMKMKNSNDTKTSMILKS